MKCTFTAPRLLGDLQGAVFRTPLAVLQGPKRQRQHTDPTKPDFWNSPFLGQKTRTWDPCVCVGFWAPIYGQRFLDVRLGFETRAARRLWGPPSRQRPEVEPTAPDHQPVFYSMTLRGPEAPQVIGGLESLSLRTFRGPAKGGEYKLVRRLSTRKTSPTCTRSSLQSSLTSRGALTAPWDAGKCWVGTVGASVLSKYPYSGPTCLIV